MSARVSTASLDGIDQRTADHVVAVAWQADRREDADIATTIITRMSASPRLALAESDRLDRESS